VERVLQAMHEVPNRQVLVYVKAKMLSHGRSNATRVTRIVCHDKILAA
jgi:hypothetical protein